MESGHSLKWIFSLSEWRPVGLSVHSFKFFISIQILSLLTNSKEQNPSWEANRYSSSLEIGHLLQNMIVLNHFHQRQSFVPTLSQTNSVLGLSFYFWIHLSFILHFQFIALLQHFPRGTKKIQAKHQSGHLLSKPCFKPELPECAPMKWFTWLQHLICSYWSGGMTNVV